MHVIDAFGSLATGETEYVTEALKRVAFHKDVPVTQLHRKAVKNNIVEFYAACIGSFAYRGRNNRDAIWGEMVRYAIR